MGTQTDEVVIDELDKPCSFNIGYHSTRNSQTCDRHATSMVLVTDAPRLNPPEWRCDEHQGMINACERGEVAVAISQRLLVGLPHQVRSWLDVPPYTEPY